MKIASLGMVIGLRTFYPYQTLQHYTDSVSMSIHVAIPEPTSDDQDYNQRSLPQYIAALESAGAIAVPIPLDTPLDEVARLLRDVQGILLPGSHYDVDPQRFGEERIPECGDSDGPRTAVDDLLLREAFNLRKPVLGICHGAQTLNVWRGGSMVQHLRTAVNHSPGRTIADAHPVQIAPQSRLAALIPNDDHSPPKVNSSHHQAVRTPGKDLRTVAISPEDGVIEAVELDSADHFVIGVQWHPERTYAVSAFSRAIFAAFLNAAREWGLHNQEGSKAADE